MKGEIVSTQFNFEVKYFEEGVRKYLHLLPDTDTSELEVGMEVEFDIVCTPDESLYAKIETEWDLIEQEYMKDEYPVFGGPFTNALTPFEWLRRYYKPAKRKD